MPEIFDAFGEIYSAYLNGEPSNHIVERDDGLIRESESAHYYFRTFDEWPEYEQDAIKEAKGKVLDVGLGAGRHALYLQEQGFEVVGIDTSPLALEIAKRRGIKDCRLMDLFNLDFPDESFDTVLLLGGNFALGNKESISSFLTKLYDIVAPDGIVIGHTRNPLKTDDPAHLAYHDMNRRRGMPPGQVKVRVGFQGKYGEWFEMLLMEEILLEEIIDPIGWMVSKYFYSDDSSYIAVLTK